MNDIEDSREKMHFVSTKKNFSICFSVQVKLYGCKFDVILTVHLR